MQEGADQVARGGSDLLANDDVEARCLRGRTDLRLEGAINAVMVRDGEMGHAARSRRANNSAWRRKGIE